MKRKSRYALSCPAAPCARSQRYSPRPHAERTGPHAPTYRVGRAPRAADSRSRPAKPAQQAVALSWCPLVASRPPFTTLSCCTDRSSPVLVCACAATHETIGDASSLQSSLPSLPSGYSRPRSQLSAIHAQYSTSPAEGDARPSVLLRSAGRAAVFSRIHIDRARARTSVNEILRNHDGARGCPAADRNTKIQALESSHGIRAQTMS